jgi:hypothetical protein
MPYRGWVCLLLGTLAWGQAAKPASPPAPAKPAAAAAKPANAAEPAKTADPIVITIDGLCEKPAAAKTAAAKCQTLVTRTEFENLVKFAAPTLPPSARKRFATSYANALMMAHQAHKMGLDKSPRFEELMKLARLRVMAQELSQTLQEKSSQISDKEIEDYYHSSSPAYEEANVQRLFIPKTKQLETSKENAGEAESQKRQQEAEAAMKTEAEALRARVAAGEDPAKLQEEAYQFAGLKGTPPATSMGKIRRTGLPPTHSAVMDLKPNETSQLISDQTGYFVYKMGEKDTLPLEKVRDEIHNALRAQHFQDSMQAVQQSATASYDEKYFAVPATPAPQAAPPAGTQPATQPPSSEPK